jgi:hypothetical protein
MRDHYICEQACRIKGKGKRKNLPLQILKLRTDKVPMEQEPVDSERITIPRWTIKRDPRALGCSICGSAIVKITAEWRQVSFCTCRLIEYRVLPRAPKSLPAPFPAADIRKDP